MRHATAPGGGDPPAFRLGDCATQRNLSESGRAQARTIGELFRREGVVVTQALSSRWCRALDTARLAFPDVTGPDTALDSFFAERASGEDQTRLVRDLIERWQGPGVLALVSHQVNITALTGVFPAEGEVLVLRPRPSGFDLVGRLRP